MTAAEVAWAAGLFEGEGTARINARTARNLGFLHVSVANNDRALVEPFLEWWGGSIRATSPPARPQWRRGWRWAVAGAGAARVLEDLLPYLRAERNIARARLGLEYQAQKSTLGRGDPAYAQRQQVYFEQMRALNATGPVRDTAQQFQRST